MEFEKITKIEAAKRQTIEAIRLFFERRDPLIVHTIIGAAHEILQDIGKKNNIIGFVKDPSFIKPEKRKEYYSIVNHPKNFLKHARHDPDDILKFNSTINELWLFDANSLYKRITEESPHEMHVFGIWFMVKNPHLFFEPFKSELQAFHESKDFEDYDFWLNALDSQVLNKQ